ncbi:MAG: hypothetical protein ACRCUM_00165 [Mycoplasmoidaceae bacterium]
MKKRENKLLKIGLSETKRNDVKSIYIKYALWLKDNKEKVLSKKKIIDDWKRLSIYDSERKRADDISRELHLIRKFGLGTIEKVNDSNEYIVFPSEVSMNIDNNEEIKLWGMENVDFFFFQLLLKQTYKSNGKSINEFKDIYMHLKINNYELVDSILLNSEYEQNIKEIISSKNEEALHELIKYKSGSSTKNKERDKIRDEIILKFSKLQILRDENIVKEIANLLKKQKFKRFPDGFTSLLFGKKITMREYLNNIYKYNSNIIFLNENELFERIKLRIIEGSKTSYLFLIKSHLNSLRILFEFDNNNILKIDFLQKEQIENILNSDKLNKLILDKYYSVNEFIKMFNINNNINFTINQKEGIVEKYYNERQLIKILISISECYVGKDEDVKKIKAIIDEHPHIKGQCDKNTFFEFISGLVFLNKSKKINNDNVRECLNMKLDSFLVPQRFAGPGLADASILIDDKIINVEPTTELYRQTTMELDSSRDHLIKTMRDEKIKRGISVIVAPLITKKLNVDIEGWNYENKPRMSIRVFDIKSMIDFLESKVESFEFLDNYKIDSNRLKD